MATLFTALVLTAIGSAVTGSPLSETTRCYVCGPQSDRDLFPGQPPPPPCDHDGLPDVPRVCPSKYRGCLTSYDGKTLTRTCELLSLDNPCKVVNGEVFCYCGGALCNNQPVDELRGVLRDHVDVDTTEDGSGDGGVTDDEDDYSSSSSTEESTASTMAAIPTATRDLGLVGVRFTTASHRDRTTPRTTTSDDMFISSEETGASATTELSEESQPGPGPGSGSGPGPKSDVLVPGLLIAAWAVLRWRGP